MRSANLTTDRSFEAITNWQVGSALDWKGTHEGKEIVFVKGSILAIEPGRSLVYTTIDPNAGYEDSPTNYLVVTYRLTSKDKTVLLEVSKSDFDKVQNAEKRFTETFAGWPRELIKIKTIAVPVR